MARTGEEVKEGREDERRRPSRLSHSCTEARSTAAVSPHRLHQATKLFVAGGAPLPYPFVDEAARHSTASNPGINSSQLRHPSSPSPRCIAAAATVLCAGLRPEPCVGTALGGLAPSALKSPPASYQTGLRATFPCRLPSPMLLHRRRRLVVAEGYPMSAQAASGVPGARVLTRAPKGKASPLI